MARKNLGLKEIVALLKEQKAFLENKFNIKEIGIFGSYVREEQNNESDIDILVPCLINSVPGVGNIKNSQITFI